MPTEGPFWNSSMCSPTFPVQLIPYNMFSERTTLSALPSQKLAFIATEVSYDRIVMCLCAYSRLFSRLAYDEGGSGAITVPVAIAPVVSIVVRDDGFGGSTNHGDVDGEVDVGEEVDVVEVVRGLGARGFWTMVVTALVESDVSVAVVVGICSVVDRYEEVDVEVDVGRG
jgi:hypothetical protein